MYSNNQVFPNTYYPYNKIQNPNQNLNQNPNDERLIGGFLAPFLLGGIAGTAAAPLFYGGYNRPYYNNYYYYPQPYYRPYPGYYY